MILGRAAHTLILEGRKVFDESYAVGGPINEKTGKEYGRDTQAYEKWLAVQKTEKGSSLEAITSEQWYVVSNMARAVHQHEEAAMLLRSGVAERVVRTSLYDVSVQIRMDWFTEIGNDAVVVDLKTCDDLDSFVYDAKKYLYGIQFAFYRLALSKAVYEEFKAAPQIDAYAIAVEKKEPFRVGVFKVSDDTLDFWNKKIDVLLKNVRTSTETGEWPTLYEDIRLLEIQ
jgi:hypothetical protein